jgi:esterase/lipase
MRDFARTRADDWERAAREELDRLRAAHRDVAVCGMSMGGALAFLLAASVSDVRAVVALAPYVQSAPGVRLLHFLGPVASLGATWVTTGGRGSVRDTEAAKRLIAYRRATPRLLRELLRVATRASGILARVQQPVLVFQSREDNRISPATAEQTFAAIGSQDKTFEWVAEAGHVISVDRGHDLVERRTVEWLQCRLP